MCQVTSVPLGKRVLLAGIPTPPLTSHSPTPGRSADECIRWDYTPRVESKAFRVTQGSCVATQRQWKNWVLFSTIHLTSFTEGCSEGLMHLWWLSRGFFKLKKMKKLFFYYLLYNNNHWLAAMPLQNGTRVMFILIYNAHFLHSSTKSWPLSSLIQLSLAIQTKWQAPSSLQGSTLKLNSISEDGWHRT